MIKTIQNPCPNQQILSGIFTSVDAKKVLYKDKNGNPSTATIKGDNGFFELTILERHIFVRGINTCKGWINCGYGSLLNGKLKEDGNDEEKAEYYSNLLEDGNESIKIGSLIRFYWSDSPLSLSCERECFHEVIVKVVSPDEFKLIQVLNGTATAFGSWKRLSNLKNVLYNQPKTK